MKTEDILRYKAEFKAMQEAFGTALLVFDFPRHGLSSEDHEGSHRVEKGMLGDCPRLLRPYGIDDHDGPSHITS